MSEKAEKLYNLMHEWNAVEKKPDFIHDGLTCTYVNNDSIYVNKYGINIKDHTTIILKIRRVTYYMGTNPPWRTTVYDKSYSDRIDELIDALAKAIEFEETRF